VLGYPEYSKGQDLIVIPRISIADKTAGIFSTDGKACQVILGTEFVAVSVFTVIELKIAEINY
jgi:hypothetical protein